jgi:hypothetical protein
MAAGNQTTTIPAFFPDLPFSIDINFDFFYFAPFQVSLICTFAHLHIFTFAHLHICTFPYSTFKLSTGFPAATLYTWDIMISRLKIRMAMKVITSTSSPMLVRLANRRKKTVPSK